MSLTKLEQATLEAYNQNAQAFAESRDDKGAWRIEREKFCKYFPKGKLLEVGAGGGRDAKVFIQDGYDYTGIDLSSGLLLEARKNNSGANFSEQSVYDLNFPDDTFEGFWSCATLLHMPKNRIDVALQSIHRVVQDGGIGAITLKMGEGERVVEGDHVGMNYSRFFSFYQEDEFAEILRRNRYTVLESYQTEHSNKPWLVFFVKVMKNKGRN